jgi:very-short-patch-repair endonuclease
MPPAAKLAERAHAMRRTPTEPENRLWRNLSNAQLAGFKFRRQAVIAPFIVDFLCPAKALIVEVDGDTHEPEADWRRDAVLEGKGYRVLRFTNADVMGNMEGVLVTILDALRDAPDRWPNGRPHPNPSPEGEGLGCAQPSLSPSPSGEGFGVGPSNKHKPNQ